MVAISPMRMTFAVTLGIAVILGIVSLSTDSTILHAETAKQKSYVAFSVIGSILIITSLLLILLLLLLCGERYKPMMVSIIICTAMGMICHAVSVGVKSSIEPLPTSAWMLSTLWTCVIAVIIALVFLVSDPESI
ncbi:hypothetical protein X801_02760 [Opisthorchis viverrini]|uniref:Uncharacterized protein n=2 Tax=Opisthorchis viverrini TaxID=6198 RepID=A0A1S8X3V5_OPIVI|nr:hypothetical protein T265_05261 [Opisthorchis viverrini]KER27772.1 hypothetical protein T265_05261 [Opisthorchis viverrini]OON21347.1 hypothetical protein X801_02760 [Opisthorchis viverrini]